MAHAPAGCLAAGLLATALAACGLFPAGPPTLEGPPIDCVNVPQEACDAAVSQAGLQAAEQNALLVQIRVLCTSAAGCTNEAGDVTYEAILSNGQSISAGYAWAAAPQPAPGEPADPGGKPAGPAVAPICLGVPPGWCRVLASDAAGSDDASTVVSIVVRCIGTCTTSSGEGATVVTRKDGSRQEGGWGYEGTHP